MHESAIPSWFMLHHPETGETMTFNIEGEVEAKIPVDLVLPTRVAHGVLFVQKVPGYGVRVCFDSAPEENFEGPRTPTVQSEVPDMKSPVELPPVPPPPQASELPPVPPPPQAPELPPVPPAPPVDEASELPPVPLAPPVDGSSELPPAPPVDGPSEQSPAPPVDGPSEQPSAPPAVASVVPATEVSGAPRRKTSR